MKPYRLKILSRAAALRLRASLKRSRRKVVFTNGCFDILHAGHADSLFRARALGDALFVGLNSDRSVRSIKGRNRPIHDQRARAELLASLEAVSCVVVFGEDTPEKLLAALKPDILVKGADWRGKAVAGADSAGRVAFLPLKKGYSTSAAIRKIRRSRA